MDQAKLGQLIAALRKEKGLTQEQLGKILGVSNKSVSRWERGECAPDISLLGTIADSLGISIDRLMTGELSPNRKETGNMKRIKFYCCPNCGNIMTSMGSGEIACCGRKLEAMKPQQPDDMHAFSAEPVEDESYITFTHPMEKGHYITFAALVGYDRMMMVRLYPEQDAALRLPRIAWGTLYWGCSEHGLFSAKLK